MSKTICEICGMANSPSASVCARCAEPLDAPTQISPSPFARPAAPSVAQTVIDLPIVPPARDRPTAPVPPSARSTANLDATAVFPQDLPLPRGARREPAMPPMGLPKVQSRVPTQALTQEMDLATRPTQADLAAMIERTTEPFPGAQDPHAPPAKPPLRQRLAQLAHEEPTHVPQPSGQELTRAVLYQHVGANVIDAVVLVAMAWALGCILLWLSHHGYPHSRPTAFENLAVFLARTGSLPTGIFLAAFALSLVYGAVGALRGVTFGRAVMGLVLVGSDGRPPHLGGALWHALGCGLNILTLGAGSLWLVVDRSHRTWACLLSRTQVVPRHQLSPR